VASFDPVMVVVGAHLVQVRRDLVGVVLRQVPQEECPVGLSGRGQPGVEEAAAEPVAVAFLNHMSPLVSQQYSNLFAALCANDSPVDAPVESPLVTPGDAPTRRAAPGFLQTSEVGVLSVPGASSYHKVTRPIPEIAPRRDHCV
jgi:hypothetical protein